MIGICEREYYILLLFFDIWFDVVDCCTVAKL